MFCAFPRRLSFRGIAQLSVLKQLSYATVGDETRAYSHISAAALVFRLNHHPHSGRLWRNGAGDHAAVLFVMHGLETVLVADVKESGVFTTGVILLQNRHATRVTGPNV